VPHLGAKADRLKAGGLNPVMENQQAELAAEFYELGLNIDDLVEAFHAGLMRCDLRQEQPSQAISAYQHCQRTLWNHLGVAPSEATTRLHLAARAGRSVTR
jgi:DNA-binding SARP family transcriptional activator